MRLICIAILVAGQTDAAGQILLERSVLGVSGFDGGAAFIMHATAGEPVITTLASPGYYLTQGFHQPRSKQQLNVLFSMKTPCGGLPNGIVTITQIEGCGEDQPEVYWNGQPGQFSFDQWGADSLVLEVFDGVECAYAYTFKAPDPHAFCALTIYNIITPNGDGANDKWVIENIDTAPNITVTIVNRSGQTVWKSDQYDNQTVVWEGKDTKGRDLPNGTYYYLIEAQGQQLKGFVELLR